VVQPTPARSALARASGYLAGFTHTLNPYVGCAFGRPTVAGRGCPFCYVAESPVQRFAAAPWGTWVRPKLGIADRLRRALRSDDAPDWRIFIGSATDPYQGAEARFRLTRGCLEAMVERPPGWAVLQTRSVLAARDLDILPALGGRVVLSVTLETDDEGVRRLYTPTSPTVRARLELMRRARRAGVRVQAAISPALPCDGSRFAALLEPVCDRVIVDTFFEGDGSGGRRSRRLGMPEQLARNGHGAWWAPDAHGPLMEALRARFGSARVGFSQAGFTRGPD
jgi:DNA repair photolyase